MAAPKENTTSSSRKADGELLPQNPTSLNLIPSGFHCAASTIFAVAPSLQSVLSPKARSPLSGATLFSSNDTTLPISSPPSVSFISEFFRIQIPNHKRRQNNLIRGTQGWVSQEAPQDLPEIVVRNICIAHYVGLIEQSKDLTLSSGKGRRTAAFKATAKALSLQPEDVRKGCPKGVNLLLLARLGGPGSLLLIGRRVHTLWEKDMLSEDVPHLLQFRRKHMPDRDIQARQLNDLAIEIISRFIAAQGWEGLSLMTRLTRCLSSELEKGETRPTLAAVSPKEPTAELSSDHRKRPHSAPDRPSKRLAHGSSEDLGLMRLPKAAPHECQNTFVDPFHQQVGGPEITTMETAEENGLLNTWMQGLAPWPVEEPDITAYMTAITEDNQSNRWMQDLAPWPVEEPDITAYMTTTNEDGPTDMQMQDLFLQPLEVPDLTTYVKPCEQEGCLLP